MVYLNADFIFPDEFADGRSYCFNFIDSMPSFTRKKTKTKYNSNIYGTQEIIPSTCAIWAPCANPVRPGE